jgi:threonine synthase
MKPEHFPEDIRSFVIPKPCGSLIYRCLGCRREFGIERLLYTCPSCGHVFLIYDANFSHLKRLDGHIWRKIFNYRKMVSSASLKGIYRFYEFIGPIIPLSAIVYLGEGNTPVVEANLSLQNTVGLRFFFKNEGQNPSASFKDRGMASAISYLNFLIREKGLTDVLAICASTGDTSASAALYAAYLNPHIKSAVLLPKGKVTAQQLSQPLGNGCSVFEIPGVFDDCMKVVEFLSENYNIALLNSKNSWRILGQESYSYEIAENFEYQLKNIVVIVPIGNAGNISAVMSGFLKFYDVGLIDELPKIVGVQSRHANPVFRYYASFQPAKNKVFEPMIVKPSVAQAAMIGNPVSIPRVIQLADRYNEISGKQNFFVVEVREQEIIDAQLTANRNGHIACPQGGESLAGLCTARKQFLVDENETAILASTAHALKFSDFQQMYFDEAFPEDYDIISNPALINKPFSIARDSTKRFNRVLTPNGKHLDGFIENVSFEIAKRLELKPR